MLSPARRICNYNAIIEPKASPIRDYAKNAAVNHILDRCAKSGPTTGGYTRLGAEIRADNDKEYVLG